MLVLWEKLDQERDSTRTIGTLLLQGAISKPWKPNGVSMSVLYIKENQDEAILSLFLTPSSLWKLNPFFMESFLPFVFKDFSILLYIQKAMETLLPQILYVYICSPWVRFSSRSSFAILIIWMLPMHFFFFLSSSAGKFWRSHVTPVCISDIKWWLLLLLMVWYPLGSWASLFPTELSRTNGVK